MDDRILAKILHWIVGPSNRDHLPNLTLTTTRSGKQYLSVKKAEREIGTSYLQSILSFTRSVLELVSVAVGCYASNHWSWSDQDHFSCEICRRNLFEKFFCLEFYFRSFKTLVLTFTLSSVE